MAVDLNADIGKIIKDLFSGKKASTKAGSSEVKDSILANKFVKDFSLKSLLAICITILLCYVVFIVTSNPIKKLESEFQNSAALEDEIDKLDRNTASAARLLQKNTDKTIEKLPKFSDLHGSQTIFKQITQLASQYNLIIKNLNQTNRKNLDKPLKHSEVEILLEMEGYYSNYLNFKKKLEKNKPYLKIKREVLVLNFNSSGERKIEIVVALTDYAIEKTKYEDIASSNI